ncbi:MAG: hypothetical protein HW414_220 [Dehalococcoidia bacterium]|nr:hypothetical protein [Dehalococcoidia bacterium]
MDLTPMTGAIVEPSRVGEVVEASTASFVAQCYELHQPPPLGSLVRTRAGSIMIYGIVFNARTGSIEPGRRPIARGQEEEEEADIFKSNPQLTKLLRTDFEAVVVGYRDELLHQYLPPAPGHIHSFVHLCEKKEVEEFSGRLDFLDIILGSKILLGVDELVGASLRYASGAHADPRAFLVEAGRALASSLGGDLHRLNSLLKRLK